MQKLLVFLKAPRPGLVKTRMAETMGAAAACDAYYVMAVTVLLEISGLQNVCLCFAPDDAAPEIREWLRPGWEMREQGGGNLGERLERACRDAFETGATRVVIIGTDCPTLTAQDIREAWASLTEADVVIGPASDGGYWLIGMRRPVPALFAGVNWSTVTVFNETMERVRTGGLSVKVLRELDDIDTEADWCRYLLMGGDARS